MSARSAIAPRPSASADLARLAVPLLVIAAAIGTSLWLERGGLAIADATAGAPSSAESSAR